MKTDRPQVNADDDRLFDFFYPWTPDLPSGVYERGMSAETIETIYKIADKWMAAIPRLDPQIYLSDMCDCQIAYRWVNALKIERVDCGYRGELVDHQDAHPRSGYRLTRRRVFPHLWVVIGREQLIFDPTASQFIEHGPCDTGNPDTKVGISRDRYVVNGRRFLGRRLPGHSPAPA
jgi:hypothetical protein